jgi:hypothetical protein
MCVGMVSYGVVWLALTQDIDRSYSVVALRHAQGRQQQQQQQEWEQQRQERLEQEQRAQTLLRTRRSKSKSGTHSTTPTITAAATRQSSLDPPPAAEEEVEDDNEPDWVFWVLSAAFLALSYCRIRLEPDYRRRRALQHPPPPPLPQEQALMHTLRRVNHEREARGEEPISMDAYQALRQALLQDRALWRGLMAQQQQNQRTRSGNAIVGATPEQLEACPQRIMAVGDVTEGDSCSICLTSYQLKDRLRELPCRHCFHMDCIDQWLERSTLCPICKTSLG